MTGTVKLNSAGGGSVSLVTPSTGSNRTVTLPDADVTIGAKNSDAVLTTQGDILYQDGSGLQRLAKGTAGKVLKMNSAANAPEWGTGATRSITADTGWVEMVGSSGSASQILLTGIAASAMKLTLFLSGARWNSSVELLIELGDSGGIETTGYVGVSQYYGSAAGQAASVTDGWMSTGIDPGSIISGARIDMWRADSTTHKWQMWGDVGYESGTYAFACTMHGFKTLSDELTQIRVGSDGSSTINTGSEYRLITWT